MDYLPLKSGYLLRDRYLIVRLLHQTGNGAVYEARDTNHPDFMALRSVKEYIQEGHLDTFLPRYKVLTELTHPHIPTGHDYFVRAGLTYYVSDLIQGRDLEYIMGDASHPMPVEAIHQWAIQLADVVHYLHSYAEGAIIHRDIKPANLMIDQRLRLQVVDFDIAGIFPTGKTDEPLGTDGYAAPEQYQGVVTPQIDIFGMGATLHHLLSGKDPRVDVPFSQVGVSVRLFNEAVSPAFDEVVQKMVAYDPHERHATAADVKRALQEITPLAS